MYVLAAHPSSPITQILWLEDKQQLITCAKDKKVKIWSFPQVWYDEEEVKAKMGILPKKTQSKVVPEEVKEAPKLQPQIIVNLDNPLAPPTAVSSNFDLSDGGATGAFHNLDLNATEDVPLDGYGYQQQNFY